VKQKVIPNTFIIGAQKSGTSFLAAMLSQHKDVCVSEPKEPHFFSIEFEKGWDFYNSYFSNPDAKIILDASTTYSFLKHRDRRGDIHAPGLNAPVPKRIYDTNPESKFIYILRDPVERLKSAYLHKMRKHRLDGKEISLIKCIEEDPMLVLASRYTDQIDMYTDYFEFRKFKFLSFKDLIANPTGTLEEVCSFIDIEMQEISLEKAKKFKNEAAQKTEIMKKIDMFAYRNPAIKNFIKSRLSSESVATIRRKFGTRPVSVKFYDEEAVAELFLEEKARIQEMTGLEL